MRHQTMLEALCLTLLAVASAHGLPAFPGAEGFGSQTPGGRGGAVLEVTNLNDTGPGSFRAACEASGPRIVVFRVGGIISLKSRIYIRNPYITIAGQTAPGDGICVRGGQVSVNTHDVVIRYLRCRAGDNAVYDSAINPDNRDAFEVQNSSEQPYNVIFDHCSASWGIDENMSTWYACHDITIQWCIIAEGLHNSLHSKGPHSKGMLLGDGGQRISVHHSLFACNDDRNPMIKGSTTTELINNVVYGWGPLDYNCVYIGLFENEGGIALVPSYSNIVGNYFKAGSWSFTAFAIRANSAMPAESRIFLSGNIGPSRPNENVDDLMIIRAADRGFCVRFPAVRPSGISTTSAAQAYDSVLTHAGATRPLRDTVDRRIVANVRSGTGRIIDSQSEVGGYPEYRTATPPADTDHDGMPDLWEQQYGFSPSDAADGSQDADSDGYTNVEEYLNQTPPLVSTNARFHGCAAPAGTRHRVSAHALDIRGREIATYVRSQGVVVLPASQGALLIGTCCADLTQHRQGHADCLYRSAQ